MAMRSHILRKDENDVQHKILDNKMLGKPIQPAENLLKKERGALGDIGNKFKAQSIQTEKDKKTTTGLYKDVKPRVETRWKRSTATATTTTTSAFVLKESVGLKKTVKEVPKATAKPSVTTRQTVKPAVTVQLKNDQQTKPASGFSVLDKAAGLLSEAMPSKTFKSTFLRSRKDDELSHVGSHSQKLLSQVLDIDKDDHNNPQLLSEYVKDIYAYLSKLEDHFPIRPSFLNTQIDINPRMRSVLLDWINEVHFQFNLETETYYMAVSMIDRYLQSVSTTMRKQLQLVGVSALFMASKYEELFPPDITDFVYVTDDTYTKQQILEMEKHIFKSLGFHLGKPLPIHFLRRFAKAARHLGDNEYALAKYIMELATVDYGMSHNKPSEIAAAALLLAIFILNKSSDENELTCLDKLWTPTLEYYSTYSKDHLMPIVKKLGALVKNAPTEKLKSVYTKYSSKQFKSVAKLPELTGTKMTTIIN